MAEAPTVLLVTRTAEKRAEILRALPADIKWRACLGAVEALQSLEEAPVGVILAQDDLGDMDGIEFAETVRDINEETGEFSYVAIIATNAPDESQQAAIPDTVDAWLTFLEAPARLATAVASASGLAARVNTLLQDNARLQQRLEALEENQLQDPVTGIGNRRYALQRLNETIRQVEARGGAVCYLLLGIMNIEAIAARYDTRIVQELVRAVATRAQGLVRPLDAVAHLGAGRFAIVLHQPSIEHCTAACYQRVYDGVRLKSYKTSAGFTEAQVAMSLCASEAALGPPNPETLMRSADAQLADAWQSGGIHVKHLS